MGKLTTGFKFFLLVLVLGGGAAYLKFGTHVLDKKSTSGTTSTVTTSKPSKSGSSKDADLVIGVNTWSPYGVLTYLNGGLEPNTNSIMYTKYGIKLRIKINDVFENSRQNFMDGNYNLVYCTADVLPIEMGSGSGMSEAKAVIFLQTDWSRGGDAIVARKGINTVADFKGKTIAYAVGTASNSLLIKVLELNNLTIGDVILKKAADGIEAAKFFKAGQVDIAVVWSPDDLDCVAAIPGSKVVVNTKVATHIIADGVLVKQDFLNNNKDLLTRFASAWLEGNASVANSDIIARKAAQSFVDAFKVEIDFAYNGINNARLTTLGDNKNFFGLNPQYQEITGEQLYSKMSIVYSDLGLAKNSLAWRNVSDPSIVEGINLTENQEAEGNAKFTPVTSEVKNKAAISNKQVTINFPTNSSTLTDDAQVTIDREFVNIAKTFATARIRIEGNTDAVGDASYNKSLSFKRAQAVADYLTRTYRFDSNRFIVIGNGMTKAVNDGISGANETYRRTDFKLVEE
jgi:NitT/TauT family transport system substrate-binding protein